MKIEKGTRVGFWGPPFKSAGIYVGPDLGDHIIGTVLTQDLAEGTLKVSVGVLFRPDRARNNRLETILIFNTYIPEMWTYEHWAADETMGLSIQT